MRTIIPNAKWCAHIYQHYLGRKLWENTLRFKQKCRSGGNKLSKVRSFMILRSGEGLTGEKKVQ